MNDQQEYVRGFTWSLPTAFIDAIAICKFTQGDILYNSKVGYKRWGDAIKELKHSIQVKSPQAIKSTLAQEYLEDDIDINFGSFVEARMSQS